MLPKCGLTSMPGHEALAMFLPIMILGFLAAFASQPQAATLKSLSVPSCAVAALTPQVPAI